MPLGMDVGLAQALDGDTAPLPQKGGRAPPPRIFSAHVHCGQTVGWIKMVRGMEVGLGQGHIVLDGDPAHPKKGKQQPPPLFSPYVL